MELLILVLHVQESRSILKYPWIYHSFMYKYGLFQLFPGVTPQ
jgi:hypothetical protein